MGSTDIVAILFTDLVGSTEIVAHLGEDRAERLSRRDHAPLPRDAAVVKDWRYVGRGWANAGDTWLAETAAAELADARRHARQARRADTDHD